MEVDKSKCLICEVSCRQKGLAFFRFPKEEIRRKMWIKEISPLLDILKIPHSSLRRNGRICARHFREKDFVNSKHNSLVHSACPSLSVSNLTWSFPKDNSVTEESSFEDDKSSDESEKDVFQCGRCKAQFEALSDFMDHKRLKCQPINNIVTQGTIEKTEIPCYNYVFPVDNSISNNVDNRFIGTADQDINNYSDKYIKIFNQESAPDNNMVPLIMNENGMLVGKPLDIPTFCPQVILMPQLPMCYNGMVIGNPIDISLASPLIVTPQTPVENQVLLNNVESEPQVSNLFVTTDGTSQLNKDIIYTYPVQNNDDVVLTSDIQTNHIVLTDEIPNLPVTMKDSKETLTYSEPVEDVKPELNLLNIEEEKIKKEVEKVTEEVEESTKAVEQSNPTEERDFEKPKPKLPCSYCGKMFEKPFNVTQHERVHTGERPFQCIICGRAFTQKSNVRKHMMRHKVWPKVRQTLRLKNKKLEDLKEEVVNGIHYSCQYCNLSFESYGEHKKHLVAVHSDHKVYRCIQSDCNETFTDLDEFLSHSKMHSMSEFQCHICLKVFTNLEDLGIHQYDHDETEREKQKKTGTKLKCKVCHARFKSFESLKNHLAVDTHHYECIHCQSVFCSERFLRRHLFIHIDPSESKFQCPDCKKSFRTSQSLKNHTFIHLKEKPFTCDHCEKTFASKYRLKRHVAIHINQHLECPFKKHLGCEKTFVRKDKLREHISSHEHCESRSCGICSKMFWTLSKLREQKRKARKGEKGIFKCCKCSQTFRKHKQFSNHNCTVERRTSQRSAKSSDVEEKEKRPETVSNIEILMVPMKSEDLNSEQI